MKLDKAKIDTLSTEELKTFIKTANDSKLSEAAQSIIKKKKLDPDALKTIRDLLK